MTEVQETPEEDITYIRLVDTNDELIDIVEVPTATFEKLEKDAAKAGITVEDYILDILQRTIQKMETNVIESK